MTIIPPVGAIIPSNASAQYSIDNGTVFPFSVISNETLHQHYNLVSFETGRLLPGPHTLFVQYNGVPNTGTAEDPIHAPLILDYFLIQNQTFPSVTSSPPNTTSPGPQSPTITPIVAGLSQGAIAGVAIGSFVGLALIIFGLIRFIKGKKATP